MPIKYKIGIIGLGYVGLPLAQLFLEKGHTVFGVDTDQNKIINLINQKSYLTDFSDTDIKTMQETKAFHVSTSYHNLMNSDAIILCVPTPLKDNGDPNLRYIQEALYNLSPYLKKDQLIVLESSTYPGTTEEIICPFIEEKGFMIGKDFYVAYSPERINPGQNTFKIQQIPKIIGGITPACTDFAKRIYSAVFNRVVEVSSARAAEMSKLVENSQRLINISFINEISILCHEMDLDVWEVIDACQTKPFGFTTFFPGPGIGGHCIPVDPIYLSWKAKKYGLDLKTIEAAHKINLQMPKFIIQKLEKCLDKKINHSKVLIIGVTYKKDVNDIRESPSLKIIADLLKVGCTVDYHDPYVPNLHIANVALSSVPITATALKTYDCCVLLTDHTNLPLNEIVEHSKIVLDTRNATRNYKFRGNIIF